MATATEPLFCSLPQAATRLGISYASLKRLKAAGVIRPAVALPGRHPKYNLDLLIEQIATQEK